MIKITTDKKIREEISREKCNLCPKEQYDLWKIKMMEG